MSGKFYGADTFRPRLIVTQMAVMQSGFWLAFATLVASAQLALGQPPGLWQLFRSGDYTWETATGCTLAVCLWATALTMAVALRYVVERAKKCLDFVFTYHFFHFIATCFTSGFPAVFQWWAIQIIALLIAVFLGEYICMQAETKAIQLSSKPSKKLEMPAFQDV